MRWHCRMSAGGLLFFALLAANVSAQSITGRVIDPSFNTGIAGVRLVVLDSASNQRATADTDSLGNFRIVLERGTYRIEATRIGFRPVTTDAIELARRELVEVELRMSPTAVNVDPLVITARRQLPSARLEGYYRRLERARSFGMGRFVTRAQIDSFPAPYVSHYLARAGLRVTGDAGTARVTSRGCELSIFLDGMRVEAASVNDLVSPVDLEGIEIYRSELDALPIEFSSRQGCGAILLWTREGGTGRLGFWKSIIIGAGIVGVGLLLMHF